MPVVQEPGLHVYGQLPRGEYYIGDLSYVFPNDVFLEKLEQSEHGRKIGIFHHGSVQYAELQTMNGDGAYLDHERNEYLVDTGSIGCFPVSKMTRQQRSEIKGLGHIHSFEDAFDICYNADEGSIVFGEVHIETDYRNYPYWFPESPPESP